MSSDALHRRCVAALWRLVEASCAGGAASVNVAVGQATAAVRAAMGDEPFLILHERDGALHIDGRALAVDADLFQPLRGLAAAMQRHGVGETLFDQGVGEADLRAWAAAFARSAPGSAAPVERDPAAGRVAAPVGHGRRWSGGAQADSRLRAVYLQHRLLAAVGDSAGPAALVRSALHGVVERLLELDRGLEPLAELQRRPGTLAMGLRQAVAAIVLGRLTGLADRSLAQLGIAALGTATRLQGGPTATAVPAMVDRAEADFWIRCEAIAAEATEVNRPTASSAGMLVRCAVAVAGGAPLPADTEPEWLALVEAAGRALGLPAAG